MNGNEKENGTELSNDQVQEIVTRKQGRRDIGSFVNPPVEPGENSRFLRFALASWDLPPIDISDPEQVRKRIGEYFQHCADNDRKPQIVGMCNWLGIDRKTLNNWVNGELRSSTHLHIIKKAVSMIEIVRLPSGFWSVWIDGSWLNASLPSEKAARSLAATLKQKLDRHLKANYTIIIS